MKKNNIAIESFIFLLISSIMYVYLRKNNPNNIIGRYYMTQSKILYNAFKISTFIIQFTLFFNLKFILILIAKNYFHLL